MVPLAHMQPDRAIMKEKNAPLGKMLKNTPESTLERKQAIMEQARDGRLEILKGYLEPIRKFITENRAIRSIGSNVLNDAFLFGTYKQTSEAIRGRTWDGKQLTALGRINHLIVHALYLYAIKESGMGVWEFYNGGLGVPGTTITKSGTAYMASWFFDVVQYHPNTVSNILSLIEDSARKRGYESVASGLHSIKNTWDKATLQKLFFKKEDAKTEEEK